VKLYSYQELAVTFHLAHHYSLNLCEMGLGKTLMALETARRVGGKVLIFCPAFLVANWRQEITRYCSTLDYQIVPYSQLSRGDEISIASATTIIADEVHYLVNPSSKRTKFFRQILKALKPDYFIGLTGTPIKNRVPEFYSLLSLVSLNPRGTSGIDINQHFRNQDHFASRYCYGERLHFGSTKVVKWYGLKAERLQEFKTLLKDKVFKVRAEDVLELPPLIHKKVYSALEPSPDLAKEFEAYLQGGKNIVAKKASAILKAKATMSYVGDIIEQGNGPVVVFTDHVESAKMIGRHFAVTPITGETPSEQRSQIAKSLEMGRISVLVATIGSFSVGVNLTCSNHLVFNDCSWVPASNLQALKRIHRIGQTERCVIHYILAGHVDEFILDTLQKKLAVIDTTNSLALS
jgi:SNF2 family DNA or RNA helicase